ncbi:MAG: ABC transporter ATP-binding protein, partial [Bdellovibrionales bacterium]|nr:ABC transporter ATP-binding protein [Bdellovibrionales bacterium]
NLTYFFKSNWALGKKLALKELNLAIEPGESFGFLGHNGAGKTTTIKCILNLILPSSGAINIFGIPSQNPLARQQVGFVPEQPYFYDHLRVGEIVEMYARLSGVPSSEVKNKVGRAVALLGLSDRIKSPMRTLSKGLIQRVAMAQAIVHQPRLLILDEPFSGLDPLGRKEFADLIFNLKEKGTTIFMSSHILGDVEFICDRASIMVKGAIKGIYDLKHLTDQTHGRYHLGVKSAHIVKEQLRELSDTSTDHEGLLHLEFDSAANAQKALRIAAEKAEVHYFRFQHGGLEELFVKLVKEEV